MNIHPDDQTIFDYLLGFQTARERHRMKHRIESDNALRETIEQAQADFAPLSMLVQPVNPPEVIWTAIEKCITPVRRVQSATRRWVWAMPAGIALAAGVVVLVWHGQSVSYRADLRATAAGASATPLASIEFNAHNDLIVHVADMPPAPDEKVYELWIVPAVGAPRSLGVMPDSKVITLHTELALNENATLAVSLEPRGGSPTGSPTGPVVASGVLRRS